MGPDANGNISLCEWLDKLPDITVQRLHMHKNAQNWRAAAKYTADESHFRAKNLRGGPYI
jgi:hypothetical protein